MKECNECKKSENKNNKAEKKKWLIIIAMILLLVVGIGYKKGWFEDVGEIFSFVSYNKEEKIHTNTDGIAEGGQASGEDEEEMSLEDKRYLQFPIESNVSDKDTYYDYSNEKQAWWFKRDDNHGPSGCDDVIDISEYGGYYLDSSCDEKVIYLTFDCGYENSYTDEILDVLKAEDVPACFFVTKTYIRDNQELTIRMKEEGHQVGNHTITHPSMPEKSYEEIIQEISGCADYMKEVTGYQMDPYLRPPMGEYSERTLKLTQDLGYKTIFWSMAYVDFDVNNQPGKDYVINHFKKYHHNGAIILMHNVSSSNAEALETVIKNLKAEGYRFASLNEL